jgi:ribosomal protein S27AE
MADDMQVNVDVKGWITGILKHCPECGSKNLATHEEEGKLKHRCLDCLVFFANSNLEKEKSGGD